MQAVTFRATSERPILIDFKEMLDSWRNGSEKVLKIGKRTWWLRKKGKEKLLSLLTNKLRTTRTSQWQKSMKLLKRCEMELMNLKRI